MDLLGIPLTFGNQKQKLIVKRLDEDYKRITKLKYIEGKNLLDRQKKILEEYKYLLGEKRGKDQYNKDLIQLKMDDLISLIVEPRLEQNKKYYEENFNSALEEKRRIEKIKLQKKFKGREVVLNF